MDSRLDSLFLDAASTSGSLPTATAIVVNKAGETLYKHVSGRTNLQDDSAPPMKSNTQQFFYSCSKLVTAISTLQLFEQGKIASLDDPVEKYVPGVAQCQVLRGFREDGSPELSPPRTKPTVLHLLTHTSGLAYDWNNADLLRYMKWVEMPIAVQFLLGERRLFEEMPLMFEPGSKYEYGLSSDWLGLVIEGVTGMKMPEYVKKYVFEPTGMKNSVPYIDEDTISEAGFMPMHTRDADSGALTAVPQFMPSKTSEVFGGGHWLISTLDDYTQILLTVLNNGIHPVSKAQLLKAETVDKYIFTDALSTFPQLAHVSNKSDVGVLIPSVIPNCFPRHFTYMPGTVKGWSCAGLMINETQIELSSSDGARTGRGRSKGSGAWFGMGNLYYWIDRTAGVAGLVGTNVMPSLDKTVLGLLDELEMATYEYLSKQPVAK